MNKRTLAALAAITLALVGCDSTKPDDTPVLPNPPVETREQIPGPTLTPTQRGPKSGVYSDGIWAVGINIDAGAYVTTAPTADPAWIGCQWGRVKDFTGDINSYIASDWVPQGRTARVVVKKSDAGVEFLGGCKWRKETS